MTSKANLGDDRALEGRILSALSASGMDAPSRADVIKEIISSNGWDSVASILERILASNRRIDYAEALADVYFSASLEHLDFDCNRTMALMLSCGIKSGSVAYNLVLSTCVEKKGVGYQSGYAPEDDPEIRSEMDRLNMGR